MLTLSLHTAGRAGNKGTAITFISPEEEQYAADLIKALQQSGAEVPLDLKAMADHHAQEVRPWLWEWTAAGDQFLSARCRQVAQSAASPLYLAESSCAQPVQDDAAGRQAGFYGKLHCGCDWCQTWTWLHAVLFWLSQY